MADNQQLPVYEDRRIYAEATAFLQSLRVADYNPKALVVHTYMSAASAEYLREYLRMNDLIEKAYVAGYINGGGANGNVIDAIGNDKFLKAWGLFKAEYLHAKALIEEAQPDHPPGSSSSE